MLDQPLRLQPRLHTSRRFALEDLKGRVRITSLADVYPALLFSGNYLWRRIGCVLINFWLIV